jgi:hypothetical protein
VLARIVREVRAAFELWLIPFAVTIVPYRWGVRLAWLFARTLPLYAHAVRASERAYRAVRADRSDDAWRHECRFHLLIDHADLFWSLTRGGQYLVRQLRGMPPPPSDDRPLLILSFHYGQGSALLAWLAAHGRPPRFLSVRFSQRDMGAWVAYRYALLRARMIERVTGVPIIYTGGARREIATALESGVAVYGMIDVPVDGAASLPANGVVLGCPVVLPSGLLESSVPAARALIVTARVNVDGTRDVRWREADAATLTTRDLAAELSARLEDAPAAWHVWHLWPRFVANG